MNWLAATLLLCGIFNTVSAVMIIIAVRYNRKTMNLLEEQRKILEMRRR
jgi:heme/copper-type cytochrome/quinol oxidase subunit 2